MRNVRKYAFGFCLGLPLYGWWFHYYQIAFLSWQNALFIVLVALSNIGSRLMDES